MIEIGEFNNSDGHYYVKVAVVGGEIKLAFGSSYDYEMIIPDAATEEIIGLLRKAVEQVKRDRKPWKIEVIPFAGDGVEVPRGERGAIDQLAWELIGLAEGVPPLPHAIDKIEKVIYIGGQEP